MTSRRLSEFYTRLQEIARLNEVGELLGWDQQVNLPAKAGSARAKQLQCIAKINHQLKTDPAFTELVEELHSHAGDLSEIDRVNVRETYRHVQRERKLPLGLVEDLALAQSHGYQAWSEARPKSNFKLVEPALEKIIALKRQEAACIGFERNPYDALFDQYEPYMRFETAEPLLRALADELRVFVPRIIEQQSGHKALGTLPMLSVHDQRELNRRILHDIGFDLDAGRLDTAPHPFMTNIGVGDLRLTTRYHEENFLSALFSTLHEMGHGLYEAGFLPEHAGTPMASPISLGIHESQSRLWENMIGRSHAFAAYLHNVLKALQPKVAKALAEDTLWRHLNCIQKSLIRVESDEVTYSLHIVIRMLLEERLVRGELSVRDLPAAWNALYSEYIGITPSNDRDGVLQDVHWYSGSVGYFPTYALGNLFGAMMLEVARRDLPQLDQDVSKGQFGGLLQWLRTHVHCHGMQFNSQQLIERIAGRPLTVEPFLRYLGAKFHIER